MFVAFDLLHLNGEDMGHLPCVERRAALQRLLGPAEGKLQFSHHIDTSGKAFFATVDKLGLEGIVSKLARSAYIGGQVKSWLKSNATSRVTMKSLECSASAASRPWL